MSRGITAEESVIVGMFLEVLLYGVYTVTFRYSLRILLSRPGELVLKGRHGVRWWLLGVVVTTGIILTLDITLYLRYTLVAFASYTSPIDRAAAIQNENWINIVRDADYLTIAAIGDAILIYRLFRLYNANYFLVIIPTMMWATGIVCSATIIALNVAKSVLSSTTLQALEYTTFGIIVVINVFATSLITLKLWRARMKVSAFSTDPDKWLLVGRIVLDSGLMYTMASLLVLCTIPVPYLSNCISDGTTSVVGIAFNLIIIRLNKVIQGSTQRAGSTDWRRSHPFSSNDHPRTTVEDEMVIPITAFGVRTKPDLFGNSTIDL